MKKIALIGAGNIGKSILNGIIKNNNYQIVATRSSAENLNDLLDLGIEATHNNLDAVRDASIVILALKPYLIKPILAEIKSELVKTKPILISVATKVSLSEIQENSVFGLPIFRVIPNTAASIQQSITSICSINSTEEQENQVVELFNLIGDSVLLSESMLNQATVLGSAGTAFAMRYIRAMILAGIEMGFNESTSRKIVIQTVKGASELLLNNKTHPEIEIDKVSTPNGCTIAGLNEMEFQGFSASIYKGMSVSLKSLDKKI